MRRKSKQGSTSLSCPRGAGKAGLFEQGRPPCPDLKVSSNSGGCSADITVLSESLRYNCTPTLNRWGTLVRGGTGKTPNWKLTFFALITSGVVKGADIPVIVDKIEGDSR
jgi:hypothetical protein